MVPVARGEQFGVGWTSLPLLRQPALVLAGDDLIIRLANAYLMTRLLAALPLATSTTDGHLGLATSADELAPLVARFLREDPHADRDRVRQPS